MLCGLLCHLLDDLICRVYREYGEEVEEDLLEER